MIQLMNQMGAGADRPEAIRSAKAMGSDASSSAGAEELLGMNDILALLDTLHDSHGDPQSQGNRAVAPEQPLQQPGWTQFAMASKGADVDRLVQDRPLAGAPGESTPALSGGPAQAPHLPLEQIEQWLAELQDLRSRHAGETEPGEAPIMNLPVDPWVTPEPQRFKQQSAVMPPQWSGLVEPRAFEQQALAGSRNAPAAAAMDPSSLASLIDEPALQAVAGRATEVLTTAAPGSSAQQAVNPIVTPAEIRLQGSEARWGEQMLQALRDQVEMQIAQRSQHATIRLDPPDLGTLDIQINHEQGKLSVQINAGQADVARLLNMLTERLRHELLEQNFTEVKVQIGSPAEQGRQGRQRQDAESPGDAVIAAPQIEQGQSGFDRGTASDVLISV